MTAPSLCLFALFYAFQIFHNEPHDSQKNKSHEVCFKLKTLAAFPGPLPHQGLSGLHTHVPEQRHLPLPPGEGPGSHTGARSAGVRLSLQEAP